MKNEDKVLMQDAAAMLGTHLGQKVASRCEDASKRKRKEKKEKKY